MTMALWATERVPLQCIDLLCGVSFTLMLVRFLEGDGPELRTATRPSWLDTSAQILGQSSYPTYLFHGPILILIGSAIQTWSLSPDWRWTWVAASVVSIGSGIALGFLAERPVMVWRATLLKRLKATQDGKSGLDARHSLSVAAEGGCDEQGWRPWRFRFTNFGPYHLSRLRALGSELQRQGGR